MEFRDYAAHETSALIGRLLTGRTQESIQHLRALRAALDAATRAVESTATPEAAVEQEIQDLVKRLNAAAAAAVDHARQEAHTGAIEEQKRHLEHTEKLEAALQAARREADTLRSQLQREAERADTADRDLDATIEAHKQVDAARLEAEAACKQITAARATIEAELLETLGLLEAARAETTALSDQIEAEAAQNAVLSADLAGARETQARLEAALAAAEAIASEEALAKASAEEDLQVARTALDAAMGHASHLENELAAIRLENGQLAGDLAALREEIVVARAERDASAAAAAEGTARIEALERSRTSDGENLRHLEARLNEAVQAEAGVREQVSTSGHDLAGARAEAAGLHDSVRTLGSLLDSAVQGVDALARAGTVSDLLSALVQQLSNGYPRVALFRVKGNHLEGEHQAGFDATSDATKLVLPLNVDSLITRAATTGLVQELTGADLTDSSRAPFGGTPAAAIALPIAFQDETFAVVYADADRADHHESSAGFARLLTRHTAVLLTRLSQELKTLFELREYATMLLQEAEQMYAADVEAGRNENERRRRLKDTVECARQLYAQRAALEGTAAAALLDEQLTAVIEAQAASEFGRDLANVAGHVAPIPEARRSAS
jgi:hypothetical protein